ncbi:hypothetical protein ACE1AT_28110 [Pelatocladus sp. BLCC-F211]|uniref:hypothetical protein n=1 Tax=Pelatocladus sp. BLCC-F211 TaxID=3342752 RepID=UPI0035BA1718
MTFDQLATITKSVEPLRLKHSGQLAAVSILLNFKPDTYMEAFREKISKHNRQSSSSTSEPTRITG